MNSSWTRRRFVGHAARTSLAVAVAGAIWGCAPDSAPDAAPADPQARARATLQRVSYLLFPYPEVGTGPYERVAATIGAAVETDAETAALVTRGLQLLDDSRDQAFLALDEAGQLEVLEGIADDPFFAYVLATTRTTLFNDRTIWAHIGYDPNLPLDDIDWLGDT